MSIERLGDQLAGLIDEGSVALARELVEQMRLTADARELAVAQGNDAAVERADRLLGDLADLAKRLAELAEDAGELRELGAQLEREGRQ